MAEGGIALAWKIAQSPLIDALYIAPGNAGIANCGTTLNIDILDFEVVKNNLAQEKNISLVLVGPERRRETSRSWYL